MSELARLFEEVGAEPVDTAPGEWCWRGVPVRVRDGDPAAEAARLGDLFAALGHLPDPVPVAPIDLFRRAGDGDEARAFVPVVSPADGLRLKELGGDSFLLVLDRDSGSVTALGEDAAGAPVAICHRVPKASLGHEAGLVQRSAVDGASDRVVITREARQAKWERIAPLLRCPRCRSEQALTRSGESELICPDCAANYPVVDGVPILLADPAAPSEPDDEMISSNTYSHQARALFARFGAGLVLDCGCGQPAENLGNVVHLDVRRYPNVDVVAGADALPFRGDSFDAAVCESVLEHVRSPWTVADELHRVLKAGAPIRVDVPFLAPFHGFPEHYQNFTQSGLDHLLRQFERIDGGIEPHQEPWLAIAWILRVAREGRPDDDARVRFDAAAIADVLSAVDRGEAPAVLTGLDDDARRTIAAGFYFYGRKR